MSTDYSSFLPAEANGKGRTSLFYQGINRGFLVTQNLGSEVMQTFFRDLLLSARATYCRFLWRNLIQT